MKIALASDVHLEFGHLELNNVDNADVLVLSGDICVASKFGPNYDRFFQDASRLFKNVQFRKIATQVYFVFLLKFPFCGQM